MTTRMPARLMQVGPRKKLFRFDHAEALSIVNENHIRLRHRTRTCVGQKQEQADPDGRVSTSQGRHVSTVFSCTYFDRSDFLE